MDKIKKYRPSIVILKGPFISKSSKTDQNGFYTDKNGNINNFNAE